jgi:hypothetical protein
VATSASVATAATCISLRCTFCCLGFHRLE